MTPEINQLEDMLDELIEGTIRVIQTGHVISPEQTALITEQIAWIESEIERLYRVMDDPGRPPPVPPTDGIQPGPFPSSNIYGFQYDPESSKLLIKFQDKHPATNGPIYSYDGVPPQIVELLGMGALPPETSGRNAWHRWERGKTPSMGATAIKLITSGQFPFRRLS